MQPSHIRLQIPDLLGPVGGRLAQKMSEARDGRVNPFVISAGVGIMDKDPFENGSQIPHQKVMNHAVPDIRSKYVAKLETFLHKVVRRRGVVCTGNKLLLKVAKIVQVVLLKTERV